MFVHLSVGFLFHCKDLIHSSVPLLFYFSIYKIPLVQKKEGKEVKRNLKHFCFLETKSFVANFDNIVKFVRNIIWFEIFLD